MKLNKTSMKRFTALLLLFSTIVSSFGIVGYANDDITISVIPKPDVDIVLTLGETTLNANTFQADIKEALRKKGIDVSRVNVTAINTENLNLQNSFTWNRDISSSIGSITIQNNGTKIQMYGNQYNPGFNKIYTANNTDPEIKEQTMSFSFNLNFGDSFDGAGVLINTHVTGGSMNGYALIFLSSGTSELYRLNNWNSGDELIIGGHSGSGTRNSKATKVGTISTGTSGNFQLKMQKDKLTVIKNGSTLGSLTLSTHYGWGLGFFSDHYSHACSQIGEFSLNSISLSTKKAKEFKDVIREPNWRESAKRFIVNLEDKKVPNFDDASALGEILTRLTNEEIHYIGWGTSTNRTQALDFIKKNNNNGTFVYNNSGTYASQVEQIAQYIIDQLNLDGGDSQYVLLGEPIDIQVSPPNLAKNTQTTAYPQGRWKIDHDYEYFHNSLGQASWANQWQKDLLMIFDKPGKYDIWFEDKHPSPRYIYAHRRPVADFTASTTKSGTSYTVTIVDKSFDQDLQNNADKGIAQTEWKYKKTTDVNWTNGKPTTLPAGNEYIIQLRVKDHQGVWSFPQSKYISTNASTVAPPVANFTVSPSPLSMYQILTVSDSSYDPGGRAITGRTWTVTNSAGTQIYSSSSPMTNFRSYGAGEYTISLKVKNDANLWSETFSRKLVVTDDINAPEAIFSPPNKDWTSSNISVSITFTDSGGSGFKNQRYALSQSTTTPTSGWSSLSTSTVRNLTISNEGTWYIHIEAQDNAGNMLRQVMGTYNIDKTAPTISHTLSPSTWTNGSVNINISASDSGSKVNRIKLPNGNYVYGSSTTYTVSSNGSYVFEVEDNVGNKRTHTVTVDKIDKVKPHATSIQINNDAEYTNSRTVTLSLSALDNASGVAQMQFKNEDGSWSTAEAYKTSKSWTLSTGDGIKTVWVRYKDNAGNWSDPVSDTIKLDTTAPAVSKFVIQDDKPYYNSHSVYLNLKITDAFSGIKEVYISNNNSTWTTFAYAEKINWTLTSGDGNKTVYMKVVDNAGNMSSVVSDTIFIDTVKPTGSILINNGDEQTMSRDVKLRLTFADNSGGSGIQTVRIIEGDSEYTFPTVPSSPTTIDWRLDEGTGMRTVNMILIDKAGNISNPISDSIIVDKLSIEQFTLTDVVNPVKFNNKTPFTPKVWNFSPQPMLAGGNISFAVDLKTPYDASVVEDSVLYKVEIIGGSYHKVLTGEMELQSDDHYSKTITIPEDASSEAKVYVTVTAKRQLLVSPFDLQTVYFPGVEATTKAQIGVIEGNIHEQVKFNETY